MARRSGKIIRFSRSYRTPKPFDMGLPKRRKRPRGTGPLSGPGIKIILGTILILIFAGPTGDFLLGWGKAVTPCRVMAVIDGDTVGLSCPGRTMPNGRILGYDTPELFSPRCPGEWARAIGATYALRAHLWRAKEISVIAEGRDRYDRALVRLRVDGISVAAPMIEAGWGRAYAGGRRESWCRWW